MTKRSRLKCNNDLGCYSYFILELTLALSGYNFSKSIFVTVVKALPENCCSL